MKIAIDIDGVIADWNQRYIDFTNTLFSKENKPEDVTEWELYDSKEIKLTEKEFIRGFEEFNKYRQWQKIEPYPDTVDALCAIDSSGHEIYYITARPTGSERSTLKFLLKNGFPIGRGIIFCASTDKAKLAKSLNIDVAIDDKIETLNDYKVNGIKPVGMIRNYNKGKISQVDYPYGCDSVNNMKEFLNFLKKIS